MADTPAAPTRLCDLLQSLRDGRPLADVLEELRAVGISVSLQSLYNWHNGTRRPAVQHLTALLTLYGASDAERLLALSLAAEADPAAGSSVPGTGGHDAHNDPGRDAA